MSDLELRLTAGVLGALAAAAALCVALEVDPALRAPVVLAALLLCPGWACVAWISRAERSLMWAAGGALSCALTILVSLAMVRVGGWYPRSAVAGLLLVSGGALLSRAGRTRPAFDERPTR
jgi:hypothetical protein